VADVIVTKGRLTNVFIDIFYAYARVHLLLIKGVGLRQRASFQEFGGETATVIIALTYVSDRKAVAKASSSSFSSSIPPPTKQCEWRKGISRRVEW